VGALTAGALADGVLGPGEVLALETAAFLFQRPFTPAIEPDQAATGLVTPAGGSPPAPWPPTRR
jgi:hypothetical protein